MTNIQNFVRKYIKNEDGLVTIEWVGIAAVVVIAGILISTLVMRGANVAGSDVGEAAKTVASGASTEASGIDLTGFGDSNPSGGS